MDRPDGAHQGIAGGLVSSTANYRGLVTSPGLSGEADLVIEAEGLLVETAASPRFLAYHAFRAIEHRDYAIALVTDGEETVISRLGDATDWFFKELCEAFNAKVQTILKADGPLLFETRGPAYRYGDRQGHACIRLFEEAVMLLPPNMDARRIPLVFLTGLEAEGFSLTLNLRTGESYQFSQMGENQAAFERTVKEALARMRSRHADRIRALDPSIGRAGAIEAARLLPEGLAVTLKGVEAGFPSLAACLERLMTQGPAGPYYESLKTVGRAGERALGFKACQAPPETEGPEPVEGESEHDKLQATAPAWALWAALPSLDGKKAIVEFAFPQEQTATYLFTLESSFEAFLVTLNRAFEASGFQRELLFLAQEAFDHPDHVNDRMLLERTPSLQALRRQFAGRVIHRSLEGWKKNLLQQLN